MERPAFVRVPRQRREDNYYSQVVVGTPSDGELRRGDTILRISNKDTAKMTHNDAQKLFTNAGNSVSLVVRRDGTGCQTPENLTPLGNLHLVHNHPLTMAAVNSAAAHKAPGNYNTLPTTNFNRARANPGNFPVRDLPKTNFGAIPNFHVTNGTNGQTSQERFEKERERHAIVNQPHRTLPLISPSLRTKKDIPTGSYLRHVNDPFARAPYPAAADNNIGGSHPVLRAANDTLMKQIVQDTVLNAGGRSSTPNSDSWGRSGTPDHQTQVVNRQYNTPINLYSTPNVAQVLQSQTGINPYAQYPHQAPQQQFHQAPQQQFQQQWQQQGGPGVVPNLKDVITNAIAEISAGTSEARPTTPGIRVPFSPSKSPTFQAILEQEMKHPPREYGAVQNRVKTAPQPAPQGYNPLGSVNSKIPQSKSFELLSRDLYGHTDF